MGPTARCHLSDKLGLVADDVRQGVFGKLSRERRFVAGPISERRSDAVRRVGRADAAKQHFERHSAERAAGPLAGKDELARPLVFTVTVAYFPCSWGVSPGTKCQGQLKSNHACVTVKKRAVPRKA